MAFKNVVVSRDGIYPMVVSGLIPNTLHYVYVDSQRVPSEYLKPYGGLCGDPLITDDSGSVRFDYYHVTGSYEASTREISNVVDAARTAKKRLYVICNVNASSIDETTQSSARSYAKLYL